MDGEAPCCRAYHTAVLVGSQLFIFGGWKVRRPTLSVHCLSPHVASLTCIVRGVCGAAPGRPVPQRPAYAGRRSRPAHRCVVNPNPQRSLRSGCALALEPGLP